MWSVDANIANALIDDRIGSYDFANSDVLHVNGVEGSDFSPVARHGLPESLQLSKG
jgi:hypothetical protein